MADLNDDAVVQRRAAILRQSREASSSKFAAYGGGGRPAEIGGSVPTPTPSPAPASLLPSLNLGDFGSTSSGTDYLAAHTGLGLGHRVPRTGWGSGAADHRVTGVGGGRYGQAKGPADRKTDKGSSSWVQMALVAVIAGGVSIVRIAALRFRVLDGGFPGVRVSIRV